MYVISYDVKGALTYFPAGRRRRRGELVNGDMGNMIFGAGVIFLSVVGIVSYRQSLKMFISSVPDCVITS